MSTAPTELTIGGTEQNEPGPLRLVATLTIAGILSGLALAGAYSITLPMIEANQARALEAAVLRVVPGSTRIERMVVRDDALAPAADVGAAPNEPAVHAAYDDAGGLRGYAVEGIGAGFQDAISVLVGFDPERRLVVGMYVLESRETPGLGDKIFKDPSFVANFDDLAVDPQIVLVKDGRSSANEVDAITGATISSRAVVKIVNDALGQWMPLLSPAPHEGGTP